MQKTNNGIVKVESSSWHKDKTLEIIAYGLTATIDKDIAQRFLSFTLVVVSWQEMRFYGRCGWREAGGFSIKGFEVYTRRRFHFNWFQDLL